MARCSDAPGVLTQGISAMADAVPEQGKERCSEGVASEKTGVLGCWAMVNIPPSRTSGFIESSSVLETEGQRQVLFSANRGINLIVLSGASVRSERKTVVRES